MEGEEDLDILAALLEEDDNDEAPNLMDDDSNVSLEASVHDSMESEEDKHDVSNSSEVNATSGSSAEADMAEQLRQMKAHIHQLEQALKAKGMAKAVESPSPPSTTQTQGKGSVSSNKTAENGLTRHASASADKHQNRSATPQALFSEKKRVAHESNTKTVAQSKDLKRPVQKRKWEAMTSQKLTQQRVIPEHDEKDVTKERFSGLRIINPLISSVVMTQRMEGRKVVPISQIETKMMKGKDKDIGDWVTIGALVTKLPPKTSSNGNTYGIWKLSDLGLTSANNTVALFLFGEVYKQHWKTVEGSVVALLNANILPAKEKNSQDVALSLDNPKKIMLMGISKDYGHCKGTTRKDGRPCTNVINKEYGDFCEYHVNAAYKKIKSNRMEFQSGAAAPTNHKGSLMNKLQKDMSSASFMYQGKTLLIGGPAPQKKKNVSLKSLGFSDDGTKEVTTEKKEKPKKPKQNEASSEFFRELLAMPTPGTRNLVKHLYKDEEAKKPKEEKIPAASASQLLQNHHTEVRTGKRSAGSDQSAGDNQLPMLGRGIDAGLDIVFDMPQKQPTSSAKRRALSVVRHKGPIAKDNPNAVRKKRSPSSKEEVEKRVEKDQQDEDPESAERKPKRRRLLGLEFSAIDLNSEEGKRLLAAKSLHVGQVEAAQAERQEQYFSVLEKKEQLEDKLKSIKEIVVKVYSCKKCDYIAESASNICYKDDHPIKQSRAAKRFFLCKNCKQRAISYGSRMPKPCQNCGKMNYERTSMYMERKGPKIAGETLLVRGEEHEKFMNSLR